MTCSLSHSLVMAALMGPVPPEGEPSAPSSHRDGDQDSPPAETCGPWAALSP